MESAIALALVSIARQHCTLDQAWALVDDLPDGLDVREASKRIDDQARALTPIGIG